MRWFSRRGAGAADADMASAPAAAAAAADAESALRDSGRDEELQQQTGWHSQRCSLSLPEAHASIKLPAAARASPWRMMLAFAGCGTIISVGYM
jgi:hypothetical protein